MSNFFQDQFELILGAISGAFGGAFGWIVGRRKNKAEGFSIELENVKTILEINRNEFENLKKRVDQTHAELHNCRQEMERVLTERLSELRSKTKPTNAKPKN